MHLTRSRLLAAVALVVVLAAAWTTVRLLLARGHLDDARTHLGQARDALLAGQTAEARRALDLAGKDAAAARSTSGDPVTRAWGAVPVLGRSVTAVRGVASAADDLTEQVLRPTLATTSDLAGAKLRAADGTVDVAALPRAAASLASPVRRADDIVQRLRDEPSLVLPPVAHARSTLLSQVRALGAALKNAQDALDAAPDFLGAHGTKRWFVLVQQPGEARGTGGLPGGFAILEARNGRLTAVRQGSNSDLKPGIVSPPKDLPASFVLRYQDDGIFALWQNVNLSPDLPKVARVIEGRWQQQYGEKLDGVVALDPHALADLLKGSPPLKVGDATVKPDLLQYYLGLEQYRGVDISVAGQAHRKDQLAGVAKQVLDRVTSGGGDNKALLGGLITALRSGHVHFATDDPALQPLLHRTGIDGALPEGPAPVAYPVLVNAAGGKLDYFLNRKISYTGEGCSGRRRKTTITLTLRSTAPAVSTLPPYVTFDLASYPPRQSSTGLDQVNVYGTRGAKLVSATLDGKRLSLGSDGGSVQQLQQVSEAGMPVWQVNVDTPPNKDRVLVLHLDEPVVKGAARVPVQPLTTDLVRDVRLPAC